MERAVCRERVDSAVGDLFLKIKKYTFHWFPFLDTYDLFFFVPNSDIFHIPPIYTNRPNIIFSSPF